MAEISFMPDGEHGTKILVSADFQIPISPSKFSTVLRTICDVIETIPKEKVFFEGIVSIEMTTETLSVNFLFITPKTKLDRLDFSERDDLPRFATFYVIHVFAKVDQVHRLGEVPFPPDFRNFIDIPRI